MIDAADGIETEARGRSVLVERSARRVFVLYAAAVAASSVFAALAGRAGLGVRIAAWTLPAIGLLGVFTIRRRDLVCGANGAPADFFGVPNALTVLRILLVPPFLVLFFDGAVVAGTILYAVAALTDVADGMIARRTGSTTRYGLLLDPVGDILSTFAVFTVLFVRGVVPFWLFILLAVRYTQFFVGLYVLRRLRATAAGKAAGVVQAVGIVILLAGMVQDAVPVDRLRPFLFAVMGAAFGAVIVSQTIIGLIALRGRGGN